jgi:hypothetical protein
MNNKVSRRSFLGTTASAAAAFTIIPNHAMGSVLGHKAPSEKLNIAVVGAGGMGNSNLKAVKPTENVVAICDVDWKYTAPVFDENPNAKSIGIGAKCTTKWVNPSTPLSWLLPTIRMPSSLQRL